MSAKIGPVRQAWYQWKALRLPWRKRFLVGIDLQGNTYWEFRLTRGDPDADPDARWRRIVHYPRSTHYSEVKVPPHWHQWLRYQRRHAPSLSEQAQDVVRQEQIKVLAAEADARWEAKPGYLDAPPGRGEKSQPVPPLDTGRTQPQERVAGESPAVSERYAEETQRASAVKEQDDPWKRAKPSAPGETWQPEAWTPPAARKR
ncbi:hypothetical protein F4821DRAFT_210448 [Hypoxylon rubiginosum]|uniref:Uncharacterized protein n=1 Tax=Hypoxylon rubiginosum TaxID=110542 RepID=A0ACC0DE67_9PEZI|nr:hypothetical protein F4821DRAFT_210448 [Hypoxylon rubiginosum]